MRTGSLAALPLGSDEEADPERDAEPDGEGQRYRVTQSSPILARRASL
jgi:hypothetical protein